MQIDPNLYQETKDAVENFPPYPDLDVLIANGDLSKVRGGYAVLTQVGWEAVNRYATSTLISNKGKPPVCKLSRRRKTDIVRALKP